MKVKKMSATYDHQNNYYQSGFNDAIRLIGKAVEYDSWESALDYFDFEPGSITLSNIMHVRRIWEVMHK